MSDPGQLRRALQATNEALALREAENAYARPCADALHAYCTAYENEDGEARFLHSALFVVHRATTPSLIPPTHVLVRADELAWLRGVRLAAEVAALAMHPEHVREVLHSLRNQLAAEPAEAA